ncbi:MAG: dockerin type I repeat-containing protein [Bacteroidales bacterium]|nr:dockerin type I repeat-containing protein [Bacteroidales bacterium]
MLATETGDENGRLITGITDKFYTVENLLAEGTFLYRVKSVYIDGTESDWSNIEEVTLFENGHGFELGDVNHDGKVSIKDVTDLINYLLSGDETGFCVICADVNQDDTVSIKDVTDLINKLLSSGEAQPSADRMFRYVAF